MMGSDDADRMVLGNSLTQHGFADKKFDYCLVNPPYGVMTRALHIADVG